MRKILLVFLVLFLVFLPKINCLWSNDNVSGQTVISPDFKVTSLGKRISILKERDQSYTLHDIRLLPDSAYREWKNVNIIFGHIAEPIWLKFQLINRSGEDRPLVLEIVDHYLFELQFHREIADGTFLSDTLSGSDHFNKRGSFQENDGQVHRNFQFHFTLQQSDTSTCYLYIPPSKYPLNVRMYVWDKEYRTGWQQYFESYLLFSFFILSFIYLILLGVAITITRLKYFWFYFFYLLMGLLFLFTDLGLSYRYFWPASPFFQQVSSMIIVNLYLIFGILFIRKYFNTMVWYRIIDYGLLIAIILAACVIPLSFFMPYVDNIQFSHVLSKFINILYITVCVLLFYLLFLSLFRSQKIFPGLFLFGFSIHGLSIIVGNLQDVGLLPAGNISGFLMTIGHPITFHIQMAFMIGMLVEMAVVFYLAIKRFGYIYKQNNLFLQNQAIQKQQIMNALVKGVEKERERWSHELHDGLGVKLSLLKQELENLKPVKNSTVQLEENLNDIITELDKAHEDLRNISHNIMPKSLHKLGLLAAVEELIYRIRLADKNIGIDMYHNVDLSNFSRFSQLQLYHIVQELLNNMIKHSGAKQVDLQFVKHEDQFMITIEDDGRGFDATQALTKGIGLRNIKNRVSVLGGNFQVDSFVGRGTHISIALPYLSLLEETAEH